MIFEAGKEYRTRDGSRARVYATDGESRWPIHGAVKHRQGWYMQSWCGDGCHVSPGERTPNDLIPPRPPVVVSDAVYDAFCDPRSTGRDRLAAAIEQYLAEQEGAGC